MKSLYKTLFNSTVLALALQASSSFAANGVCVPLPLQSSGAVELIHAENSDFLPEIACKVNLQTFSSIAKQMRGKTTYAQSEWSNSKNPVTNNGASMLTIYGKEDLNTLWPLLNGNNRSTFFSISLAMAREIRVTQESDETNVYLGVYLYDHVSHQETPIARLSRDVLNYRADTYAMRFYANKGVLNKLVFIPNVEQREMIEIKLGNVLTSTSLNAWSYGMLEDDAANNVLPVTMYMTDGPKPAIEIFQRTKDDVADWAN